jgi:hypothetical protein
VSKPSDDTPSFDNLDDLMMPDGESDLFGPMDELPVEELPAAEGVPEAIVESVPGDEASVPTETATEEVAEKAADEPSKDASGKKSPYLEWGIAAGAGALFLVLGVIGLLNLSTSVFLIAVGAVGYEMWRERERINIYTAMLGCALILVMTGIYCLWTELGRYQFEIKAKQRASLSATDRPGVAERNSVVL